MKLLEHVDALIIDLRENNAACRHGTVYLQLFFRPAAAAEQFLLAA